jgi:branched-chain amino acid transport system substrate-binding protein
MLKFTVRAMAIVACMATVASCTKGSGDRKASGTPLKVGVLSEVGAGLVAYGEMQRRGLELGIDYATDGSKVAGGRKIELIIKDTEGKPDVGVTRARELVEKDGAEILVAPPNSAVALAIMQVAKEYKKILIVSTAAADSITQAGNKYVFRTGSCAAQDALAGAKFAVQTLGKKFVGLAPDYTWGRDQIKVWKEHVTKNGGEFVAEVYAPANTTDFTAYHQKALESKAEVLFVAWAGAGGPRLFQQGQDLGVYKKLKLTTGIADNKSLLAAGTSLVGNKGLIKYHYTFPKTKTNDWLVKEHQKRFNEAPDLFTDTAFAAGQAIVAAMDKTAGSSEADKVIGALEGYSWEAPKGTFTFRKEDHQALQPMYSAEVVEVGGKPSVKLVSEISAEATAPPLVTAAK